MDINDEFMRTYERRLRAAEIERLDREAARYEHSLTERRSFFARLFHPGHSPWTVPATRRAGRKITVTAEIVRL